jgi:hypothetical protein
MTGRIPGTTADKSPAVRRKALLLAAGVLAAAAALPAAAEARGFVSFGFGVPLAGPPAYYYPPPPVYYYPPPPVYYTPPPVTYAPPVAQYQAPAQTCREYQSTTTIDGRPQQTYGTACLQPDGTWQIVR